MTKIQNLSYSGLRNEHKNLDNDVSILLEMGQYYRHYSSLRFVMLTLYFVIMGAILAVVYGKIDISVFKNNDIRKILHFFAMLITFYFLFIEWRLESYLSKYSQSQRTIFDSLSRNSINNNFANFVWEKDEGFDLDFALFKGIFFLMLVIVAISYHHLY